MHKRKRSRAASSIVHKDTSPVRLVQTLSVTAQYNSDGRSVATETVLTPDGKQHTSRVELGKKDQLKLRSFVAGLFRVAEEI
jgi:hypothetical protein